MTCPHTSGGCRTRYRGGRRSWISGDEGAILFFSPDANVSIDPGFLNPARITLAAPVDQARELFEFVLHAFCPERRAARAGSRYENPPCRRFLTSSGRGGAREGGGIINIVEGHRTADDVFPAPEGGPGRARNDPAGGNSYLYLLPLEWLIIEI